MDAQVITCKDCGKEEPRRANGQRYCRDCSARRDLMRKRLWARSHPLSPERRQRKGEQFAETKSLIRVAGVELNRPTRRTLAWVAPPKLAWMVRFRIPFTYAVSKNHIYTMRRVGHVALRRESRGKRQELTAAVERALNGQRVAHAKLWIDVLVQKPNHRGDAVNVVDLVCDAIKDATGLDDRWFCIRLLDWEISKTDPMLIVGLGQETTEDQLVCSHCGRLQYLDAFPKRSYGPFGRDRVCRECGLLGRKLARQRRAEAT